MVTAHALVGGLTHPHRGQELGALAITDGNVELHEELTSQLVNFHFMESGWITLVGAVFNIFGLPDFLG